MTGDGTEAPGLPRAELRQALARHVSADAAEEADRQAILALLEEERAFDRTFYEPGHITGSAFVLHPDGAHVLLHHHRRLDLWLQLGGHDDGEEDARATALREAREESGLADVRLLSAEVLDVDVHEIPAGRAEPAHRHFDVRYACTTASPEAIRRDDLESLELRWFSFDEAAATVPDAGTRRALARLADAGQGADDRGPSTGGRPSAR